ncbi:Oidioi.mRNA.OKI2018_I69.PAR.g10369.t1.cds [Oikopleura dioica]|uniref:Oidioi.mRNA.OKI2018_I69.PAR.g10369.t1.cds n=1 Tax=Oikopleura dioica TaxID=34765 RepID=A0ABN7RVY1_OIKDI|nr:Oidioi.mRNA.OKI2018_I69.PAR.g10369.t1.cds [Oikopleura dioica]
MHLKRLDSVDVRVTDEEADCRRVYANHFKHKAEQRGQSERRVAHEMRKKLFHDIRRSNANLISKLEKYKIERTPIITCIGPVNAGKSSVVNYFANETLQGRMEIISLEFYSVFDL